MMLIRDETNSSPQYLTQICPIEETNPNMTTSETKKFGFANAQMMFDEVDKILDVAAVKNIPVPAAVMPAAVSVLATTNAPPSSDTSGPGTHSCIGGACQAPDSELI